MAKTVWFDMDGTLYDLYNVPNWLERLAEEDEGVFWDGAMMYNPYRIEQAIEALIAHGWRVGVITWAPKGVEKDDPFFAKVENIKRFWLKRFYPDLLENFYCLPYGQSKAICACDHWYERNGDIADTQILVDDNMIVRDDWVAGGWSGSYKTIDATEDYTKQLEGLVM